MRVSNTVVTIRGYAPRSEQLFRRKGEFRHGAPNDIVRLVVVERSQDQQNRGLDRRRNRLRIVPLGSLHMELSSGEALGIDQQQVGIVVVRQQEVIFVRREDTVRRGDLRDGSSTDREPDGILRCAQKHIELDVAVADTASGHVLGDADGHLQLGIDKCMVVHIVADAKMGAGKFRRHREVSRSDLGIAHDIKLRKQRVRVS